MSGPLPELDRWIDPRGHRFGAAVSSILILIAAITGAETLVALVLLALGTSAIFGLRYSVFGIAWRRIAALLRLPEVAKEHPYPPRFAQAFGSVALALACIAFIVGLQTLGWILALAVAGLQAVLAATGFCLGCRLYVLKWWVPVVVGRFWQRHDRADLPRTKLRMR
jgi:hypothetical protein